MQVFLLEIKSDAYFWIIEPLLDLEVN